MNNPGWNGSCEDWLHGDEDLTDEQPPEILEDFIQPTEYLLREKYKCD